MVQANGGAPEEFKGPRSNEPSIYSASSYGDEEYDDFDAEINQNGKVDMEAFMTASQVAGINDRRVTSKRLITEARGGSIQKAPPTPTLYL